MNFKIVEKAFKEKSELLLNVCPDALELLCDTRFFLIKAVTKISEVFNPHVSNFVGTVNGEICSFIVNCGHTPPIIKFIFLPNEEILFINHAFQDKILEELNKLIESSPKSYDCVCKETRTFVIYN